MIPTTYKDLDAYRADGGYETLERLRSGELTREQLVDIVDKAGLRGCGGAGFPTARKWKSVLGEKGPRLMAVNADEGEPGTFKDRYYLETDPHRVLEGMLIARLARRGAGHLHLPARRVSRVPRDPGGARSSSSRRPGCSPACASTCGAAPGRTSAARSRR